MRVTPDNVTDDIIYELAFMLRALKYETEHDKSLFLIDNYISYIKIKISNSLVWFISGGGFMIIDVVEDTLLKPEHSIVHVISHIFVYPEKRKTSSVYARLIKHAQNIESSVIGFTYKDSDHNTVLQKRYKVLGTIYGN